jgi:thiosulfate/3-mercaptopyruvate sulfurtransferase
MNLPLPLPSSVVSPQWLAPRLHEPGLRVVDCRFDLDDPAHGARVFAAERIPGACFADLEAQLSAPVLPGRTGRHPLPEPAALEALLGGLGIGPDTRVVAYDAFGGGFAARLWWVLRWLGHEAVAVLDGGWPGWLAAGLPVERARACAPPAARFVARPLTDRLVTVTELMERLDDPSLCLVDARSAPRFRGEQEPRDPVAGSIPGARNAFWQDNLDAAGHFEAPARLRARFEALLGEHPADRAVFYCGSGVTGAHDLLAMTHAGLPLARLYAGSWSEWITDPSRPVWRSRSS